MAKAATFHCVVITPERTVLACDATFAAFPAHDGEIGILPNRAPLVCKLGIGVMRIETPAEKHQLFIDGGFAQMVDNRLTILTEQARKPSEVESATAAKALTEAKAMQITDDTSFEEKSKALRRAQTQLKLATKA